MVEVITVFSVAGIIIVIGFLADMFFKKTSFPDTLFLIAVGIIFGPVLRVFLPEELLSVTPIFTSLTLMIILFEGGLNMEIYKVLSQSLRATILGVLYVLMAMVFVLVFGYFVLGLGWLEALMLGPMTAGTSSVVMVPLMRKLNVEDKVAVTLSLESTITDVLNIVLVITFLQMYFGGLVNLQQTASVIASKFAVGIVLGFIVGFVWIKILGITKKQEYNYMLTIAALILCFAGTEFLGGSGSLAALLFGLALGNYETLHRITGGKTSLSYMTEITETVKKFQGEIAFLIRSFFFVFLGLVYMPYWLGILYAGIIVTINLMFRYIAVSVSTLKSEMYRHRKFMTLMCGTGLANATLSILVYNTLTGLPNPVSYAYLYPLIVTNIIIVNNMITALAPLIQRLH
jgi:cell volume regulation protein A